MEAKMTPYEQSLKADLDRGSVAAFSVYSQFEGDRAMWEVESFTPSDGTLHAHVPEDHIAWLKRSGGDRQTMHVSLHLSSRGVPETEARQILDTMVAALNKIGQ
jgi:hypothetical protein